MRQHSVVLILLLQTLFCLPAGATREPINVVVVPSGTRFRVALSKPIDSETVKNGEALEAKTAEDIDVDGKVALPKGSQISGQIIKFENPRLLSRNSFALYFDRLTAADGQIKEVPIRTCDRGGILKVIRDGQELRFDVVTRPGCSGCCAGRSISDPPYVSTQTPEESRMWKSTILTPRRNKVVRLQSNDEMRVELLEDLRLSESQSSKRAK
jgi:hypothetical protein